MSKATVLNYSVLSFRSVFALALFLLPFAAQAQFPSNANKIVQGIQTTAQGIVSYSDTVPLHTPTTSNWRHNTQIHRDTSMGVEYLWRYPRWYASSLVKQSNPPPATRAAGSNFLDYTETLWQNSTDSLTYYYEEKQQCWQPVGTVVRDTTPVSTAATGTSAAVCYEYSLWYNSTNDSLYAYTAGDWLAIGSGGGGTAGAVDSIVVLQDSIIVGYSEGVEVTRDSIGYPAGISLPLAISDITGLSDSLASHPSGTGTNNYLPKWTGTNTLGNSFFSQDAVSVMMDANKQFELTGGTTASRPTGVASAMYWNTSNGWIDIHNGTSWFNPARSATTNGLFTAGSVLFGGSDGTVSQNNSNLFWDNTNIRLGIGTASPAYRVDIQQSSTTTSTIVGLQHLLTMNPSAAKSAASYAAQYRLILNGANANFSAAAFVSQVLIANTSTDNFTRGLFARVGTSSTGNAATTIAADIETSHESSGTITTSYGLRIADIINLSTITTTYGLYIGDVTAGTQTNQAYSLYSVDANARNYIAGNTGINVLSPAAKLDVGGTFRVGTLSGTVTQLGGYTAGNIASTWTTGYGLNFTSGVMSADTSSANSLVTQADLDAATTAPSGEIVYGTGTGITSNSGLKYTATTGARMLEANGKLSVNTLSEEQTSTVTTKFGLDYFVNINPDFEPGGDTTVSALVRLQHQGTSGSGIRRPYLYTVGQPGGSSTGRRVFQLHYEGIKLWRYQFLPDNTDYGTMAPPYSRLDIGWTSGVSFATFYRTLNGADTTSWFDFKDTGELFANAYRTGGESESTSFTAFATLDDLGNYHRANTATVKDSIFGTAITTATLDFGGTAAGTVSDLTVTVTGAAVGDIVTLGVPHGSVPAGGTFFAWVSATNTVTVRFANNALVTAYDPASGSFKVRVEK